MLLAGWLDYWFFQYISGMMMIKTITSGLVSAGSSSSFWLSVCWHFQMVRMSKWNTSSYSPTFGYVVKMEYIIIQSYLEFSLIFSLHEYCILIYQLNWVSYDKKKCLYPVILWWLIDKVSQIKMKWFDNERWGEIWLIPSPKTEDI